MQRFCLLLVSYVIATAANTKEHLLDNGNSNGNSNDNSAGINFNGITLPNFLAPDLTGFNWSAGGQYVAEGYVWLNSEWPVETPAQGPVNASLAVDPVAGVVTLLFEPAGAQYVTPQGFHFIDKFGVCYTKPAGDNYSTYAFVYRQMRNFAVHFDPLLLTIIKSWGGSVKDPAFGGEYGSVMAQTDAKGRVTTYAFQQTLVLPPSYTGFGPLPAKVFGSFVFTKWTQMPAPAQYVNPPASCAPGVVQNYTDVFYKPGVYFNPYPV